MFETMKCIRFKQTGTEVSRPYLLRVTFSFCNGRYLCRIRSVKNNYWGQSEKDR